MRRLRWSGVAAGLVAVAACSAAFAADDVNADASLRGIVGRFLQNPTCNKAGISFSTIKNGTIAWDAVGLVHAQGGADHPIRKDSDAFKIGSVTKAFTATLYALALNEGKLAEKDRAQNRLAPSLNLRLPVLTKDGDQSPDLTVDELARYSSGLQRGLQGQGFSLSTDEMIRKVGAPNFRLQFVSGSHFLYSNLGFAILSLVMQNTYGAPIEQLLPRQIAVPLGLNKTAIGVVHFNGPDAVEGYTKNGGTAVVGNSTWPAFDGAGALRSTPADMEIFLKYNMGLLANQRLDPLLARLQNMITLAKYNGGSTTKVGLAWQEATLPNGDTIIFKDGLVPGFSAYVGFKASAPPRTPSPYGVAMLASQQGCPALRIGKCVLEYLAGAAQQDCRAAPVGEEENDGEIE